MKILVFTGAGISRESGLKTFRDENGLWEGIDIEEVCTPRAWARNPKKVLDFYNMRRSGVHAVEPNAAHLALTKLEENHEVTIVTQNIDNLHERAGSSNIIHIHGELMKACGENKTTSYPWTGDISIGDLCPVTGEQLRPDIVFFEEGVMRWVEALEAASECDLLIVIGTSAVVYPAASLVYSAMDKPVIVVDPNPPVFEHFENIKYIKKPATVGMVEVLDILEKHNG